MRKFLLYKMRHFSNGSLRSGDEAQREATVLFEFTLTNAAELHKKNRTGHVPLSGRRTRGQTPTVLLNGRHVSPQLEQTLINTRTNNCARAPQRRKTRISSAASLFNGKMPQQSAHDVIWGEVSGQKKRSIHSSTKSAIFINATAAAAMGLNTRVQTG